MIENKDETEPLQEASSKLFPNYDFYDYEASSASNPASGSGLLKNLRDQNQYLQSQILQNQLQNRVFSYDYYGGGHHGGHGGHGGYHQLLNYCSEDSIHLGLLIVTLAGIPLMWYTLYTKILAAGGRKKRDLSQTLLEQGLHFMTSIEQSKF